MTSADRRIRFERWFPNHPIGLGSDVMVDTWNAYDFYVPGVFIMHARAYPADTQKSDGFEPPVAGGCGELHVGYRYTALLN